MPVLAKIGIGCGALLVTMILALVLVPLMMTRIVREKIMHPKPAPPMALGKLNRDFTIVKIDREKKEITLRNRKTGEVTIWSLIEAADGQIEARNEKGESMKITRDGRFE